MQRYNIKYNVNVLREIKNAIRQNAVEKVIKLTNRRRYYHLILEQQDIKLIFDKKRQEVIIFLPHDFNELKLTHCTSKDTILQNNETFEPIIFSGAVILSMKGKAQDLSVLKSDDEKEKISSLQAW